MGSGTIILFEFAAVAGGILAFGLWQLVSLRRLRRARERSEDANSPGGPQSVEAFGGPE